MQHFYQQRTWFIILIAALVLPVAFAHNGFAQPGPSLKEGVIRIKVSEALASRLEGKKFSKNFSGEVVTGVASLDKINHQHKVKRFSRVFRHAGKNEARHRKYGLHLWYEVNMDKGSPVSQALKSFRSDVDVVKAEAVYQKAINSSIPNAPVTATTDIGKPVSPILPDASNDPLLTRQWHYHNTGQTGGTPGADIRLLDAWKAETGNKNVIVALTDGGIEASHPDLAPNMWVNTGEIPGNQLDDDNNGYVDDVHGYNFVHDSGTIEPHYHGTHVAGTIGAASNNGIGVAGIAGGSGAGDGVRLMTCAVFTSDSNFGFPESYIYAADNGAVISQNSWGYTAPGVYEESVLDAIDYFIAEAGKDAQGNQVGPMKGGIVIFAAGNDNAEANYYPGFYEPVLAVASSNHQDKKAAYSNYGAWVDITAPGGEMYNAGEQGVISTLTGNQYGFLMGTSMACPHVSGIAGLIVSRFGGQGFTSAALRERLTHSVNSVSALNPGYEGKLGSGRINAALAMTQGDNTAPQPIRDLSVADIDIGQITLRWTSPTDESGYTVQYDIRYSTSPITASNFINATPAEDVPAPAPAGTTENFTITGLEGGTEFYFAVKSQDFNGNVSLISNVVKATSALSPVIAVTPLAISENLQTAEISTKTFTIRNTGEGPLEYTLIMGDEENNFASSSSPAQGVIAPGNQQLITVSFNAAGLMAGTYRQNITIESNDPGRGTVVVSLTLTVSNNNAPIASVTPQAIDFKSAQVGTTVRRTVTISNAGSEPLIIHDVTSSHPAFGAVFTDDLQVEPFTEKLLALTYKPSSTGFASGEIHIHTNDPANSIFTIQVKGEGLNEPPLVVSPDSFEETLDRGTKVTRTLVLQNNGSQDRAFRLEIADTELIMPETPQGTNTPPVATSDSARARFARMSATHEARLAEKKPGIRSLLTPIGRQSNRAPLAMSASPLSGEGLIEYRTGFEDFTPGPINGQQNWFSTQGWTVSSQNPDKGSQHFRGTSEASGNGETVALSPYILPVDVYPHFTSVSMRINADHARGTSWQIVTQDEAFIGVRIQFNPDGSMDALVIDNEYETHWRRLPDPAPSGYFDMAIEYNNWGSDTSGFPTYLLFINNQHVFSGASIGFAMGQIAVLSSMESSGPTLDIDNFNHWVGEYHPRFIKPSLNEGTIPAGQSVQVGLEFNADMRFGTYRSPIIVHMDDVDSVIVPATLSVTGEATMNFVNGITMRLNKGETGTAERTMTNTGGQPIRYTLHSDLEGLTVTPASGTIPVRGEATFTVQFQGPPDIYEDKIVLSTDMDHNPVQDIPVNITVFEPDGLFYAPDRVEFDIMAGEINTRSFQIGNDGERAISFRTNTRYLSNWISIDPMAGTLGDTPLDITLTFDARNLSPGTENNSLTFSTSDTNHQSHYMSVRVNILPDTAGAGEITRETWTGISGTAVSTIPVTTSPSSTGILTRFESPSNIGDNYGNRIRGYIEAPQTGYYTFWIASNDHSELWLEWSEDIRNPPIKKKIASVTGYTNPGQWEKYPTQKSVRIHLAANTKYYIEALHKEGVGTDHVAVGWQLPDLTMERPIPGLRLYPYGIELENRPPQIDIATPTEGDTFSAPATIVIAADAVDEDGSISKVEFFSGAIKLGTDISAPFAFSWRNVASGDYTVVARATDNLGAIDSASVNITVTTGAQCVAAGKIQRELWTGIQGNGIENIPVNTTPAEVTDLTFFEGPANTGDHYGARIRGYLCVPETGDYYFWIASNDNSALWLSTNDNPANKVKIAAVTSYTNPRQWDKFAGQKSPAMHLVAGQRYYIEVLHKEGVGTDHLAVGWQLPGGTLERPMPGTRLLPFGTTDNQLPVVSITHPVNGQVYNAPATVDLSAEATDHDGTVTKVSFYNGAVKLGEDLSAPYNATWSNVSAGEYAVTAVATDNSGASTTSPAVHISVTEICQASGTITREFWSGVSGADVSSIPLNAAPSGTGELTIFEGPENFGTNYGTRIKGYLCPPSTGAYTFWIASNDHSELWLSTDDAPDNKIKIAYITGATGSRQWDKFTTQQSAPIMLTQGKKYYIEALHKQGVGTDNIAVGWQLPGGVLERPIPGTRLSPAGLPSAAFAREKSTTTMDKTSTPIAERMVQATPMTISVYPNPAMKGTVRLMVEGYAGRERTRDQARVEIRNMTGVSVYSNTFSCQDDCTTNIEMGENFTSGVYFIQIQFEHGTVSKKLVVN